MTILTRTVHRVLYTVNLLFAVVAFKPLPVGVVDHGVIKLSIMAGRTKLAFPKNRGAGNFMFDTRWGFRNVRIMIGPGTKIKVITRVGSSQIKGKYTRLIRKGTAIYTYLYVPDLMADVAGDPFCFHIDAASRKWPIRGYPIGPSLEELQ
ncbi:MAG TPA: hypothetical protein VFY66_02920 [Anaerolineales bacterium]|nr:hypothetical protein [Anaerolineales bacterium]